MLKTVLIAAASAVAGAIVLPPLAKGAMRGMNSLKEKVKEKKAEKANNSFPEELGELLGKRMDLSRLPLNVQSFIQKARKGAGNPTIIVVPNEEEEAALEEEFVLQPKKKS